MEGCVKKTSTCAEINNKLVEFGAGVQQDELDVVVKEGQLFADFFAKLA